MSMMRHIPRFFLSLLVSLTLVSGLTTMPVRAGDNCAPSGLGIFTTFPTWHKYLETSAPPSCEIEDFQVPEDIWKIGLAVVEMVLRIAGIVATVFVIYAGFKYVMSRGNPQEAAKARQTIIDAVIGVAISSVATVLVAFLGSRLTQ